ncbi:hypothetical protein [Paraburkholderia caledonica]|uniref:hypothetical protein n=1 Tax=Paraburkholderia caledonica TaxID=134536 RepID=UPI001374C6FA|nr:hypothetical protein [Paraburkholderia caledonica]
MTFAPWKLPLRSRKVEGQKWVGMRQSALRTHRQKTAIRFSPPENGQSSTRTFDP